MEGASGRVGEREKNLKPETRNPEPQPSAGVIANPIIVVSIFFLPLLRGEDRGGGEGELPE